MKKYQNVKKIKEIQDFLEIHKNVKKIEGIIPERTAFRQDFLEIHQNMKSIEEIQDFLEIHQNVKRMEEILAPRSGRISSNFVKM